MTKDDKRLFDQLLKKELRVRALQSLAEILIERGMDKELVTQALRRHAANVALDELPS